MTCPYCNSKETISIIYLYRYNDNNTFVKKNNEEVKYSNRKRKYKFKKEVKSLTTRNQNLTEENNKLRNYIETILEAIKKFFRKILQFGNEKIIKNREIPFSFKLW